jgi:peroxiredoxin
MANDLTGDFDVVAQFAIPAVDRVLAAMHRSERFPHSLSIRVDDNPPAGSKVPRPSIVASVDSFGDATVDHSLLGAVVPLAGASAAASRFSSVLDPIVNPDLVGAFDPPVVPSLLQGRAQLQLAPPTIELSDPSGKNLTVKLDVMARYFPDAHTSPLTEFLRGELQLSAGVDQVVSQQLNMIDVNIKADQISILFKQAFPPQPLSAEDSAALNLLIRNALRTGFLPSSNPVPGNIDFLRFKALTGNPNVIAVMLNMASFDPTTGRHIDPQENPGDPASINRNFLTAGDDWGFAAGAGFILGMIQFQPIANRSVPLYNLSFKLPTVEFQPGRIVLTVKGHAEGSHVYSPPAFDFTATQAFTLKLVSTTGGPFNTVELVADGDVSVDPWYADVASLFQKGNIRDQRDANLRDIQPKVRDALDVQNLGGFLNALLKPPDQAPGTPPPQEVKLALAYTSWAITPGGIALSGSLAVPDWPAAHVEFQTIPANTKGPGGLAGAGGALFGSGQDYSALNSWIPGGTIQRYEWSNQGQPQPFDVEDNKFVLIPPPPGTVAEMVVPGAASGSRPPGISIGPATVGTVPAYASLCLTVRGVRLSSSGQANAQPVSGSACGYTTVPVVQGVEVTAGGEALMVALTQPGPSGQVEVVGHAAAQRDATSRNVPNRLVHFADDKTASSLELLLDALRGSKRTDAATAVLAVLTPDQLTRARYTPGVIYAEDQTGAWARAFGVKTSQRPLTLIAGPKGGVAWQQEGQLDSGKLAAVLAKYLARTAPVTQSVMGLSLRIGRPAPNFLFELAPGQRTTLRKLAGRRPIILVFCKSSLKASMQAALDLQKTTGKVGAQGPILLAINDGEAPALAKKVAAENGLTAVVVPDPQRNISLAYGVNIWPTTVFLDASGLVRSIRYGRFAAEPGASPTGGKAAASR